MTLYAIGDIQGCRAAFEALLEAVSFQPGSDRLWLVGDLVNRGPDSLGVLRRIIELGEGATCVLGNHDLHLLAAVAGGRALGAADTFQAVLASPHAGALVDWLRFRPLLVHDAAAARVLVHAGIPPQWDVEQACERAREAERALRGPRWREALRAMYGDAPVAWREDLDEPSRLRYTINAFTRMRYCDARGRLDLTHSGPPGSQPGGLLPWFDAPGRACRDVHVVFGHWSALGLLRRADVTALDTGCVWGGALTAVSLDPPGEAISIDCAATARGGRPWA